MGKIFKALEKSQHMGDDVKTASERKREEPPNPDAVKLEERHEEVLETVSKEPVLSNLRPSDQSAFVIDPMLVTGLNPQSVESEQFRLLKNNILFPEKGTPPKCIMITSSSPGEGKSFVAANLAISLAQNIDEHVLLMDCDLRTPTVHTIFGCKGEQGLSEYLSQTVPLSSLLVKTFMDKLTILPAGKTPPNPSELLSSEQMRRLIHEVKLRYSDRYIVIDTPPPYLTSETSVISRQVDGIVIVIKKGKTRKKEVLDIIDLYGKEKILGAVYNFAGKKIGYNYGKYGYKEYGSSKKNA